MAPETPTSTTPRPDDGTVPPPPTAGAIVPRWAVRAEISDQVGQRRTLVRVSDAEDLLDASTIALAAIREDLEEGELVTGLDGFEPRTITADTASSLPAFLGGFGVTLRPYGPCADPECPEHGTDEPTAGTAVPADEA